MDKKEELEYNKIRAEGRNLTNNNLLFIAVTFFSLIITINPKLLEDTLLAYQIVLTIPFFMSSIFARQKLAYVTNGKIWDIYGFITFIIAYSFFINSVGIILSNFVSYKISIIFFVINILLAFTYSIIQVKHNSKLLRGRIIQDLIFAALIIGLGLLPVIGLY